MKHTSPHHEQQSGRSTEKEVVWVVEKLLLGANWTNRIDVLVPDPQNSLSPQPRKETTNTAPLSTTSQKLCAHDQARNTTNQLRLFCRIATSPTKNGRLNARFELPMCFEL